jgi:hypothetical protein
MRTFLRNLCGLGTLATLAIGCSSSPTSVEGGDGGTKPGTDASADVTQGSKVDGGTHEDAHPEASSKDTGTHDALPDAPTCDGSLTPATEPCVISEAYGVFVAPPAAGGDDTAGDGSRAHPYATIDKGLTSASQKRVYVCAATYPASVLVNAAVDGTQIYGGLACPAGVDASTDGSTGHAPWSYSGAPATVAPTAPGFALDVESLVKGAQFEDLAFVAQPGTAAASSSIAVMVNLSMNVSFTRVAATAGAGAAGPTPGTVASNSCLSPAASDTMNGSCSCVDGSSSTGGTGGGYGRHAPGGPLSETPGGNGTSVPATAQNDGTGGDPAEPVGATTGCTSGAAGAPGNAIAPGGSAGAAGTLGATGWVPQAGGDGKTGTPGQGGGGGGPVYASCTGFCLTGGGGGAGGCGGTGGAGAAGGGASIGVAVASSAVTFASVSLTTAAGGKGGDGQAGENGQGGGSGGNGTVCNGASGGTGGGGAGGGGGSGGPSIGIGATGTASVTVDAMAVGRTLPSSFVGGTPGAAGNGGGGGAPQGSAGSDGTNGLAAAVAPL